MDEQVLVNKVGTADAASDIIDFRNSYGFSVQWNIAGTSPTGSAIVQGSNDGESWTAVSTVAVSASGSSFDNKDAIYYKYLRAFWDFTSGTDVVINAFLLTKGG